MQRTLEKPKAEFDIWTPADSFGEVGAAFVPCLLSIAKAAALKGYAPGPAVLCHVANEAGERGTVILRMQERSVG